MGIETPKIKPKFGSLYECVGINPFAVILVLRIEKFDAEVVATPF
jgi:hypothetical protein